MPKTYNPHLSPVIGFRLPPAEYKAFTALADDLGISPGALAKQWTIERLRTPLGPPIGIPGGMYTGSSVTGSNTTSNIISKNQAMGVLTEGAPLSVGAGKSQPRKPLTREGEMMRGTWDDPWMPVLEVQIQAAETEPELGPDGWWHWVDENGDRCRSEEKP